MIITKMTLSIMPIAIMTFSKLIFSIMTLTMIIQGKKYSE